MIGCIACVCAVALALLLLRAAIAEAQPTGRVFHIGLLSVGSPLRLQADAVIE